MDVTVRYFQTISSNTNTHTGPPLAKYALCVHVWCQENNAWCQSTMHNRAAYACIFLGVACGHQTPLYCTGWNLRYAQSSAINSCAIKAYEFDANMPSNTVDSLLHNKDVHRPLRCAAGRCHITFVHFAFSRVVTTMWLYCCSIRLWQCAIRWDRSEMLSSPIYRKSQQNLSNKLVNWEKLATNEGQHQTIRSQSHRISNSASITQRERGDGIFAQHIAPEMFQFSNWMKSEYANQWVIWLPRVCSAHTRDSEIKWSRGALKFMIVLPWWPNAHEKNYRIQLSFPMLKVVPCWLSLWTWTFRCQIDGNNHLPCCDVENIELFQSFAT